MVEIFLLEQLIAFAKYGTQTRTAQALHITQPALSRSMKKLEEAFGVPLFDRAQSKISLNETGKTAVLYAEKVLEAEREMLEQATLSDRSARMLVAGGCTYLAINALVPVLQEAFPGRAILSEQAGDAALLAGLENRRYQLVVTHCMPEDREMFARPFLEERLCVTLPTEHPLAARDSVCFADLEGLSILAHGNAGFWLDVCREHLHTTKLLVQDSMEAMHELVEKTSLPTFDSDCTPEHRRGTSGRVTLPIRDDAACAVYYLVCRDAEKAAYQAVFQAARK